jgi:hypothetical protein
MKLWTLFLLVFLFGCGKEYVRPEPVNANCSSKCFEPCVKEDGDTGLQWTADPNDASAWDAMYDEVTNPLAQMLRTCEVRRRSCVTCLQNLKDEKVIQ